ncbi:(Fe-S)-binding protein [Candidatus Formimonas warabiya]|nr:(Fe-S)-binding protein [Candidatus Formimonas warabiya]
MMDSKDVDEMLKKCNRCGACQSVCPVYAELGVESGLARGKIQLVRGLKQGELVWSPGIAKRMDLCLQCKRCTVNCPGGTEGDALIRWGRAEAQKKVGVPFLYKLIARFLLPRREIFTSALTMGKFGQKILFRPGPNGQGQLPRIPLGLDQRRVIGTLASQTLKQRLPQVNPVPSPVLKVVYFSGCMANYLYPQVGEALVRVLNQNRVEVVVPKLQHCCGMPVYSSGDFETARIMAQENIKVLAGVAADAIVVSCGSCGLALKEHYPELWADGSELREKARQVGEKVKDITELVALLDFTKGLGRLDGKVTYHDPCHLRNGMKVARQPRGILKSIPGLTFIETQQGHCCGSGGSFSLKHYDLSAKITDCCQEELSRTGAEIVATGCLACRMQLEDGIAQKGINLQVRHTVELLDHSYRGKSIL